MTPTVNKSVTKVNNSVDFDRSSVSRRLGEAGITGCYIDIEAGTKRSAVDHTKPENQYPIEALGRTYGVMPVDRLGFIDIDTDTPPEPVDRLINEHPTFTVKSPHGGEHHYYLIDGALSNSTEQWGELRTDRQYVVGAGSTIDHAHCDECGHSGEGQYRVTDDRPIATIDASDLEPITDRSETTEARATDARETDLTGDHGDHRIARRITKAKDSKHGERFTALYEGRYRDAGYSDRSDAEAELVMRLAFWLQQNRSDVRAAMNRACQEHPRADVNGARKWLVRDGEYRNSTLELVENVDRTYSGSDSTPGFRPTFSKLTSEYVLDALLDLGLASSAEIAEHPKVDRSLSQVQRVLRSYQDTDDEYGEVVSKVRDGRSIRYYAFEGTFLSEDERIEAGIE
jgi:hypothetical protein